jgi:oxygen-independent coproporphyrinogen-3 oxidase
MGAFMIQIYLSKDEFEYDIHSLVKAFYPNEQIRIIKPPVNILDTVASEESVTKRLAAGEIRADRPKKTETEKPESVKKPETDIDQNDISFIIDYKIPFLNLKAVKNGLELYSSIGTKGNESEHAIQDSTDSEELASPKAADLEAGQLKTKQYRNQLKRVLYDCLSHISGRQLPWGTLTGVRPTKIAYEKMEQNVSEVDIRQYMKEQYLCSGEKIDLSLKVARREITLLNEIDYRNGYSIYIGIPFCPSTCLYCSFTSYSLEKFGASVPLYLEALYKEITYAGMCGLDKKLTTIYIGGGTPTTLNGDELDLLLTHIDKTFDFTYVREYTVEAGRPDSITAEKLKILKGHGVTRISINPQTMSQKTLDLIGRKHTVNQLIEAFYAAREAGHDNINMDIIIGLPGEGKADVAHTLAEIDQLKPDSLTVHTLAIKRAARLNIQRESYQDLVPSEASDMLKLTTDYTKEADYLPYYLYRQKNMADNLENIGYARYGKEGLYNILIMEEKQTILALGAGALSKFIFHEENRIERVENVKSLKDYVERIDEMIERKRIFIKDNSYGL